MPKAVWGVIGGVSAQALNHVESPLGDGFCRLRAKLGPAGAVTAAAHKLARILYTMIKTRTAFDPAKMGHPAVARLQKERCLRKQAALLGFSLQPANATAVS
jgi:transposase